MTLKLIYLLTAWIFAWFRLHPSAGSPQPAATGAGAQPAAAPTWWSGASSDQAADGSFGTWRGSDVTIGGTWDNGNDEQVAMRSICEGKWTNWDKPMDIEEYLAREAIAQEVPDPTAPPVAGGAL